MTSSRQVTANGMGKVITNNNHVFKSDSNVPILSLEKSKKEKIYCNDSKDMTSIVKLPERIDKRNLMYTIKNFEALVPTMLKPAKVKADKNYTTYIFNDLVNMANKCKTDEPFITYETPYTYANGLNDGRLYGRKGMQTCPRKIRHTLCKDIYDDLDFVNSHPSILEWYCKQHGIVCDNLSRYVTNRDKMLKIISSFYKEEQDETKERIIALINNGYLTNGRLNKDNKAIVHPKWMIAFKKEMKNILNAIKIREPEAFKRASIKNPRNKLGSMISQVLSRHEGDILMFLLNTVQQDGLTVGVLCLDGLMIEKNEGRGIDIARYEQLIKEKFDINLKLKIKPMDEGIDIPVDYSFDGNTSQLLRDAKRGMNIFGKNLKLDNLREDETINQNNIGSYLPRLNKADIVMLRSNMMTFKTQNLPELFKHYKKVLIVSFRISLDKAYMRDFKQYGFKMYGNQATYSDDRLIVQVDSMHKVRGMYDLVIFDEFVYTKDHVISFVKEKKSVWEAIKQYILETSKVIICDALLNRSTINFVKRIAPDRTMHIVDNKWTSFKGRKAKMICNVTHSTGFIVDVIEQVTVYNQKVYIPTNSKTMGIKLKQRLVTDFPHIRVGFCASDEEDIPVEEWVNYDVLITTPTNVAGLSQNQKHFDMVMAYFTPDSCNAEMACQMLFRVRNTVHDTMHIYIKSNSYYKPVRKKDIDRFIESEDQLHIGIGLTINRPFNCIIKDDYYLCLRDHIKRNNKSYNDYSGVMGGILEHHGISVEKVYTEWEKEKLEVEQVLAGKNLKEYHLEKGQQVAEACNITDDKYKQLKDKNGSTLEERNQCRKHKLQDTYGKQVFDAMFVVTLEKLMKQYQNLCKLKKPGDNLENIQREFKDKEHHVDDDDNQQRLHKYRNTEQMFIAVSLLKLIGFDGVFDKKYVKKYPYDKVKDYLIQCGDKVAGLFKKEKVDWNNIDLTRTQDKKHIARYTNAILNQVIAVKVNTINKNSKSVVIKGLEVFTNEGIDFIYTDVVEVNGVVIESTPVKSVVHTSRPNIKRRCSVIIEPIEHKDEHNDEERLSVPTCIRHTGWVISSEEYFSNVKKYDSFVLRDNGI